MRHDHVVQIAKNGTELLWVDFEAPSPSDLNEIAATYHLPQQAVQDCLDPEHLPKFEEFGDLNFIILRAFDGSAGSESTTVQELTRKIAIFERDGLVITIHRREQPFLTALKDDWRAKSSQQNSKYKAHHILLNILRDAISSYQSPIIRNRDLLEEFELKVFKHAGDTFEDGYFLKRRANTFKRMLAMTIDILPSIANEYRNEASVLQDVKETGERLYFFAEEFYDNISNLLHLHLSLSSHRLTEATFRANEVMRILTIFSVFFMPLNLVTGVYGMNFDNIPELKWPLGYGFALGLMVAITLVIFMYFRRKGVLAPPPIDV